MIRLSKFADYGIVIMTRMARSPEPWLTAPEVAALTRVPQPMASKILKVLAREGLVVSQRGAKGGYSLARPAAETSVAEVIAALEGPIALTACVDEGPGDCEIRGFCSAHANWQRINDAIRGALENVTLAEMATSPPTAHRTVPPAAVRPAH